MRSGQFTKIHATDVREGEKKSANRLTGDYTFEWIDDDAERMTKKVIGYVAYFRLVNGYTKTLYMSVEEVEAHARRYSITYSSKNDYVRKQSKWATDFDAMAKKTIIKRLLSQEAPLSVQMKTAIQADQSVQREAGTYTYVDNDKETAKDALAERAKERATEDAEFIEQTDKQADDQPQPIDPSVNDLPFEE